MATERRTDPFPMRKPYVAGGARIGPHTIPWYLAEIIHARMGTMSGMVIPPLERFAQDGGFEVPCMLDLLAGGVGDPSAPAFRAMIGSGQRSIKNNVQIVVPGTKAYYEALREFESEAKDAQKKKGRMVFGAGGVFGDGQAVPRNGTSWEAQAQAMGWKAPRR